MWYDTFAQEVRVGANDEARIEGHMLAGDINLHAFLERVHGGGEVGLRML